MYDMFDYLEWRGDLPFKKIGPNPVDMLIFSTLSYINFDGIISENPNKIMPLREAAEQFLVLPDKEKKVRVKKDIELLEAAINTERFANVGVSFYRNVFAPEEEKQWIDVPLSTEGVEQAADWLNEQYEEQKERWKESLKKSWV